MLKNLKKRPYTFITSLFLFCLCMVMDLTAVESISCTNQNINSCINGVITKLNEVIQENNRLKQKADATTVYNISPSDSITMPNSDGTWSAVSGMIQEFDLPIKSKVLFFYSLTISSTEDASGAWVATRVSVDGIPLMTSGRHVQPLPYDLVKNSTDISIAAQDMKILEAGHHKIELQWRANGGKWMQLGNSANASYGGVSGRTLSIVLLPN
ncbi:MAG: hypothetical protein HQK50_05650 [Oligoflexia bacterium]|nr:hypothetical protein [Oligoflexia bacterium]MBF0365034.1 hypothetical protein [Oligoflexia bacterium]